MRWIIALVCMAQSAPSAGEKTTVTVKSTLELDIVVRDGSGESTRLLQLVRDDKFSQEVLDVADGRARSVRVKCLASTIQKTGSDVLPETKSSPLADRTYTATRGANGWIAKDDEGGAPPAEAQTLGAWNDLVTLVPKEMKEGAQWQVKDLDVLGLIYPSVLTEGNGQLNCSCELLQGNRATITFKGQIAGRGKDESTTTLVITQGRLMLEGGKPKQLFLNGGLQSTIDVVDVQRKPNENVEEKRKVGEIQIRSRRLEATFDFN